MEAVVPLILLPPQSNKCSKQIFLWTVCVLLQAGTVRDSMAKSLYSALFDWIVFRINHALLNIKDLVETTKVGTTQTHRLSQAGVIQLNRLNQIKTLDHF